MMNRSLKINALYNYNYTEHCRETLCDNIYSLFLISTARVSQNLKVTYLVEIIIKTFEACNFDHHM